MCIFFEFLGFLTPSGGSSTTPDPMNEELSSFANLKVEPLTSLVSIPEGAYAMSTQTFSQGARDEGRWALT
jgi:hypothetical protein